MTARRAGFMISEKGEQGLLGWIPDRLANVNSGWVAAARAVNDAARVGIVQRLATQNEAVFTARHSKTVAAVPEPDVRAKLARGHLKRLAEEEKKLAVVEDQIFVKSHGLTPFNYDDGVVGRDNREELRKTFAAMSKEQKALAIKKGAFRRAVLEQEPEVTGLPATDYELLKQEQIRSRYPQETADIADAREAIDAVKLTLKSARKLIENELAAVGTPAVEPVESAPAKAWA